MKIWTTKLLAALATFALFCAINPQTASANHHETGTIVEVAAGAEDFSTLVSLLQATGLDEALSAEGPFTVFAPNNKAFEKVPKPVLDELAKNQDLLKSVLLYHVVAGEKKAADVVEAKELNTLLKDAVLDVTTNKKGVKIENAKVIQTDIMGSNGVIHVIDKVLVPMQVEKTLATAMQKPSIVEIAVEDGRFTTLVALVKEAGLAETLSEKGPFTVFAPTDAAFANLDPATLDAVANDKELLKSVLLYHVVAKKAKANKVVEMDEIETLQGNNVEVEVSDSGVKINDANVIIADVEARNGIIHVIDAVLIPPSE